MTAQPMVWYKCDRCRYVETMPMQNTPQHARAAGPVDWLALVVGTEPSTPVSHLCPACARGFVLFMEGVSDAQLAGTEISVR